MYKIFYLLTACMLLSCCGQKGVTKGTDVTTNSAGIQSAETTKTPVFDADSAYAYIEKQVAFGPRVPNTEAHKACADYLATELERHGAEIYIQEAVLTAYNGDKLNARNIIGAFNSATTRRILLFAHWDTRPYADSDPNPANHTKPFDGADDGGSGVGVLLEIARQIGKNAPEVGIDIIFFDAEDYGIPTFAEGYYQSDTWCLGSQFWAKNPHVRNYKAEFGILLDMVGSKGATFYKERTSIQYAGRYVENVWTTARKLGYGKYFIQANGGMITDDHLYINQIRRIPSIDIINYNPEDSNTGFGVYWHTVNDNMRIIDKETLKAVGQTVLEVIFN